MAFDLKIEAELPAPVAQVMHLLTDVQKIRAWSGSDAVMELQEGGAFSMFGGWVKGKVLKYSASELSYTWHLEEWGTEVPESVVHIALSPRGEHTLVTLTQQHLPSADEAATHKVTWNDEFFVPLEDYIMAFD